MCNDFTNANKFIEIICSKTKIWLRPVSANKHSLQLILNKNILEIANIFDIFYLISYTQNIEMKTIYDVLCDMEINMNFHYDDICLHKNYIVMNDAIVANNIKKKIKYIEDINDLIQWFIELVLQNSDNEQNDIINKIQYVLNNINILYNASIDNDNYNDTEKYTNINTTLINIQNYFGKKINNKINNKNNKKNKTSKRKIDNNDNDNDNNNDNGDNDYYNNYNIVCN